MRAMPQLMLFLVLLTLAGHADAGWRYTEWGMSEKQVRRASGGETYSAQYGNAAYWEVLPRLLSNVRFGRFDFRAEFYFGEKRELTSIRLMPLQTIWCTDMFRYLGQNYAYQGVEENTYIWLDRKDGNRVQLSRFSNCSVTFSAAKDKSLAGTVR